MSEESEDARAGPPPPEPASGLCPRCVHVRRIESARGSLFLLCGRAAREPVYPRYPPQPVVACPGFER